MLDPNVSKKSILLTRSGIALVPMQITSGFVLSLFFTFIPLYVYDIYGFVASSLCRTLVALTAIILSWLWGWVSDRFASKKNLLAISMMGQAGFTVLFAGSQLFTEGEVLHLVFLLLTYTLASLFTAIFNPVRNAAITLMAREEDRAESIGLFFLFSSAGWGLGGFLIGYWWDVLSIPLTVTITAILHIFALFFFFVFFQESDIETEQPIRRGLFKGIRGMEPVLMYVVLVVLLVSVGRGIFLPIFQIKMYIIFGKESIWIGIISGLSGMASAIGAYGYGKLAQRIGDSSAIKLGIFGNSALFLLGTLNYQLTVALVWIFPVWPLIGVSSVSMAATHSKDTERGEAQGVVESARSFSGLFSVIGGIAALLIGASDNINMLTPIFLSMLIFPIIAYLPLRRSQQTATEQSTYSNI
jgi:MFS family permease